MNRKRILAFLPLLLWTLVVVAQASAQLEPVPAPEPDTTYGNIWYGAIPSFNHLPPDVGESAPVLIFIHGLNGTALYWFNGNDMYEAAYRQGYRTAFISLNADNSPNSESIEDNAEVLRELLPHVREHFNTDKMYLIGHSKGGVDIQAAMLDPATASLVKAVFTISSPNQGTELADWAFENPVLAAQLNLLTPGVESLKTENMAIFRAYADPILKDYKVPFFTFTGSTFTGHPVTLVTGAILRQLVPGAFRDSLNDGFVTIARSRLSDEYAADLGVVPFNHFATDSGSVSFPKILGRIQGMEILPPGEFTKIAASGFSEFGGSVHNSWAWSVKWFKGRLYVGTGSEVNCVSLLTADVNTGSNYYSPSVLSGQCPQPQPGNPWLGAEIWRYTPDTGEWEKVYKSPNTIPIAFSSTGSPTEFTARDIGFRSMEVFTEQDGTEALYVGGVTSGSVYDPVPFRPEGYPPPRLLRTVDGENWEAVPQVPGTFLGEIGKMQIDDQTRFRSFRSLKGYNGQLFANLSDFVGSGVIIASSDPKSGNDSWRQVSPDRSDFPVWDFYPYNGYLYVTTGLTGQQDPSNPGYGVYKTKAEGDLLPYEFIPVVTNGGYQPNPAYRSPNGLSFAEFQGRLYVGTNRPTELIRINPDDSWDLVVGEPRDTPQGHKAPISGFGNGFGSAFTGHFWRMASYDGHLYLGTWDWSGLLQEYPILHPLDIYFTPQSGFDLFRSDDGIHWTAITRTGMGVPYNIGARSLEATPVGLFMGTAGERRHACEVYLSTGLNPDPVLPAPKRLEAASESEVGRTVILDWEAVPGAARYRVYRAILISLVTPLTETTLEVPAPDGTTMTVTIEDIQSGALDYLCADTVGDTTLCAAIQELKNLAAEAEANENVSQSVFPLAYQLIEVTTETSFSETPPTDVQSIYFVRAEDFSGNLSDPSNIVAAPSKAEPAPLLAELVTEQAKISWKHNSIHLKGKLYPPEGFRMDDLDPVGSAVITLAGVEVVDQTVEFAIKGKKTDKWRYKDKKNLYGPIKKFDVHWKGAKFDYHLNKRVRIQTHFIGENETILSIHTKKGSGAFTINIWGTRIAYDKRRHITTDVAYEPKKKDNTHVHFTLPFRLTSDMTMEISGATNRIINVADYYKGGFARFELDSIFDSELFPKSSKSSSFELEYGILFGQGYDMIFGSDLINFEKSRGKKHKKHWVYNKNMRFKHRHSK